MAKGRPLPAWYLDRPELFAVEAFYIAAFFDLSTCRSIGMSLGPIPWTAIVEYADIVGLEPSNRELFVFVIRELDAAYLAWQAQEMERTKTK
jgi:hypothetical protein